ncbi:MAG: ABC transporter ATP-binding protein [Kofleriaceae bacterium]
MRSLVATSGPFRLQPITLEIASGELVVLLGPSGTGKTVLLEALLGLRTVEGGAVTIDGRDVTATEPEDRLVAYMPQDVALFPHLSVRANIEFGRRVRGQLEGLAAEVTEVATTLEIAHLLERTNIRSLSGGEAQRVALARALVTRPRVLFLDESFSALDAHIRRRLLLQFRQVQRDRGLTAIYVTHSLGEATFVGDRVAVMLDGAIAQLTTPETLFRAPSDLRIARFLQLDNVHAATSIEGTTAHVAGLAFELAAPARSGSSWIAISAGDVMLVSRDDRDVVSNRFAGTITRVTQRHDHRRARIALEGSAGLELDCDLSARDRFLGSASVAVGARVELHVPSSAIVVFPEVRS